MITKYLIENFVSYASLSSHFKKAILFIYAHHEPCSYEEASKHSCWNIAMQEEIAAFETNNTWVLTDLPSQCQSYQMQVDI